MDITEECVFTNQLKVWDRNRTSFPLHNCSPCFSPFCLLDYSPIVWFFTIFMHGNYIVYIPIYIYTCIYIRINTYIYIFIYLYFGNNDAPVSPPQVGYVDFLTLQVFFWVLMVAVHDESLERLDAVDLPGSMARYQPWRSTNILVRLT